MRRELPFPLFFDFHAIVVPLCCLMMPLLQVGRNMMKNGLLLRRRNFPCSGTPWRRKRGNFRRNLARLVGFGRQMSGPGVSVCKPRYDIVIWRAENRTHLSKQTRPSTE